MGLRAGVKIALSQSLDELPEELQASADLPVSSVLKQRAGGRASRGATRASTAKAQVGMPCSRLSRRRAATATQMTSAHVRLRLPWNGLSLDSRDEFGFVK